MRKEMRMEIKNYKIGDKVILKPGLEPLKKYGYCTFTDNHIFQGYKEIVCVLPLSADGFDEKHIYGLSNGELYDGEMFIPQPIVGGHSSITIFEVLKKEIQKMDLEQFLEFELCDAICLEVKVAKILGLIKIEEEVQCGSCMVLDEERLNCTTNSERIMKMTLKEFEELINKIKIKIETEFKETNSSNSLKTTILEKHYLLKLNGWAKSINVDGIMLLSEQEINDFSESMRRILIAINIGDVFPFEIDNEHAWEYNQREMPQKDYEIIEIRREEKDLFEKLGIKDTGFTRKFFEMILDYGRRIRDE
jgi:hypothetical protein